MVAHGMVRNFSGYSLTQNRNIEYSIGKETPRDVLERIDEIVRDAVKDVELLRVNIVYLKSFDPSCLVIDVRYSVLTDDGGKAFQVAGDLNLAVYLRFRREGIALPFPTEVVLPGA
eukprot:NODE_6425_length_536_cov_13.014670_g6260_i0.p1 GENE.NODE_6425_length_536_cov_13.014670_g6260_i0~~NODE_6425_length_536_cov_13.014670_g6260_i0.p1  ORF type:complete len:116 (+),score=39.54 NODE_6425_length_536_cov_13.014670_g6260_i0:121-468(+)